MFLERVFFERFRKISFERGLILLNSDEKFINKHMKKYAALFVVVLFFALVSCNTTKSLENKTISNKVLKDKIAGGWAGKIIGVTYGAESEFKAKGRIYEEPINWIPADVVRSIKQDDIYVQLTFLMAMDQFGMDAPAKKFQELLSKAEYRLWHANLQARKNYFDSIFPPHSGHPDYNLHADDIDFQIESDYIGFMCPGMHQTASEIAYKIGHIMNYGDGLYGGVFVAALYVEAFFENNVHIVIENALKSIPSESDYSKIVKDVILLHQQYPENWRDAWAELEAKWGCVQICEAGTSFNIDAKLNGAYIVMGLLYGEGDPLKTMEVSTRCGQDSDCNPSNAMAVLGVMKGLTGLPVDYQEAINSMGDSLFINTDYSFNKAVLQTVGYAHRLITQNGGTSSESELTIKTQEPKSYPVEVSFPKLVFDQRIDVFTDDRWEFKGDWDTYGNMQARVSDTAGDDISFTFNGTGVSIVGNWLKDGGRADVFVDGEFKRTIDCFYNFTKQEVFDISLYHITNLTEGEHTIRLVVKGEKRPEAEGTKIYVSEAVVFKTADKTNENFKFSFQK